MYYVYLHINKTNQKKYVGITKQKPEERWGVNGSNYKSSPYFYAAIKKYGWDHFEHVILFSNLTKKEACEKEKELIQKYNTQDKNYGYNIMEGGDAPEIPFEIRQIISKALKGNTNGKGHPCSEEKKKKIRDAQKGRPLTNEHKKQLSLAAQNRHVVCSEEKKQILSENYPYKCKVYCLETDTVYESVQECGRQLHLWPTNIVKVCKGIHHTTGGYHLEYYNDNDNDIINA